MSTFRFKRSYPETHISQRSWDERFEALVKYKAQNGHCNVPSRYKLDTGLGKFLHQIRNGKIVVTDDQRARLSALGFDWETVAQRRERKWMEMFTQFRENRSTISSTKNPKLYGWVAHQRSLNSKGKMRTDRYQKLLGIGFDWRMVQNHIKPLDVTNRHDKQWLAMYHKLVEFYQENDHAMVSQYYENDRSLGRWVSNQRQKYKERQLSGDRIRLLNDVQFVWKYNSNDASTSRCQRDWDGMFGLLKDYKDMYGNVDVPRKQVHRQRSLGQWLSNQRENARRGRLDPLRALHLMSIGVEWTFRDEPWRHYYNILEVFHKKHAHCMVPTESGDNKELYKGLVCWMKSQKDLHEKGELDIERKALLDCLGFGWGREWPVRKSKTAEELTRKKSSNSFNSLWAGEAVSSSPSYHLATDSPSPEEVLSLSPACPPPKAERQAGVSAHSQKAEEVIGALNAKVVKRAMKSALKRAPCRSMKTKYLRRHLREVFELPYPSKKRDLEQLLDGAINSSSNIAKQGKVLTLLKHHTTKVYKAEQQADVSANAQQDKEVLDILNAKVVKRAMKTALKKAPGRSMKTKHLRRHLREVLDLPSTSKNRDLEQLLDGAINSSFKIVKQEKVVTLLKHHTAKV